VQRVRFLCWALGLILVVGSLAGCGQKGPLYLPDKAKAVRQAGA